MNNETKPLNGQGVQRTEKDISGTKIIIKKLHYGTKYSRDANRQQVTNKTNSNINF